MSVPPAPVSRTRLTIALFLPALAWFQFQQGLIVAMRGRCTAGAPPVGLVWGLVSLALCLLAMWLAGSSSRPSDLEGRQVSRFMALLALIGAGLFALAIIFQTMAILIVPPCIG
jgi:hypothetical protein